MKGNKEGKGVKKDNKLKKKSVSRKEGLCFVAQCGRKKKSNQRVCSHHTPILAAIKYQSERDSEVEAYKACFQDPEKAKWCCDEHERLNPPGTAVRKRFIDWGQWRKRFGIRKSQTDQDREELMDEADYVCYQRTRKVDSPIARKRFKQICEDPRSECEGDGAEKKAWAVLNKRRLRETERFEEGGVDEGSKIVKNMKQADINKLKAFAVNNQSEWSSGFLGMKSSSSSRDSAPEPIEDLDSSKKKRAVNVSTAGPREYTKNNKAMGPVVSGLKGSKTALEQAVQLHESMPGNVPQSREILSYREACDVAVCVFNFYIAKVAKPIPAVGFLSQPPSSVAPSTPARSVHSEARGSPETSPRSTMSPLVANSPASNSAEGRSEAEAVESTDAASHEAALLEIASRHADTEGEAALIAVLANEARARVSQQPESQQVTEAKLGATVVFDDEEGQWAKTEDQDRANDLNLDECRSITRRLVEVIKKIPSKHRATTQYQKIHSLFEIRALIRELPDCNTIAELEDKLKNIEDGREIIALSSTSMRECAK